MPKRAADYQRVYEERNRQEGLVRVSVWVPEEFAEHIKSLAKLARYPMTPLTQEERAALEAVAALDNYPK